MPSEDAMNRTLRLTVITTTAIALAANAVTAQFVVYDPTNYAQAIVRYAQLVQQYRFWVEQARRLPVDMATRYRVPAVRWHTHDPGGVYQYARAILAALNAGDSTGTGYNRSVERLEALDDVLSQLPSGLQRRLATRYGTIQLADSVNTTSINQLGRLRDNGTLMMTAIANMESDAAAGSDQFHTHTALLNKINGAGVLGLRINETASQLQLHILEQLLVQNKRSRDAETQAMDAHLFQWRYGAAYGRDLFSRTASNLDRWRQP
jgi:hypothetical protein